MSGSPSPTDERASGLILRVRPLTETSLIVSWLTAEQGRIATVAKGARRTKSPLRGKLDLFFSADFSFRRSKRSELHNLREVVVHDSRLGLRHDIDRLRVAGYATAVIEAMTETETPLPETFDLMAEFLEALESAEASRTWALAFEGRMLNLHGLLPEGKSAGLNDAMITDLERMLESHWGDAYEVIELKSLRAINFFLKKAMADFCGRLPRGRDAVMNAE